MSRRIQQEQGFALAFALLTCVVLSITTVSVITYTSSSSRSAGLSSSRVNAHDVAEAGISAAASIINKSSNAASPTLLGCTANGTSSTAPCTDLTVSASGGTASFSGLYAAGSPSGTWTITSNGDVPNPAGGADSKSSVTATVVVVPGGMVNNLSIWNYVFSSAPQGAGCEVDISGNNVVVDVPVYVTGDLCISGQNAAIMENPLHGGQKVDVMAQGKVVISGNNAHIGASGTPITSGVAGQGCTSTIGGTGHTCTSADHWYVGTTDTLVAATPPTTDYPGYYTNASPGPNNLCDTNLTPSPNLTASGNQPHAFDNDGTMNGTNAQFNLTPASDYNCVTSSGQLSWNHTTHVLTISGTIFFDGNVTSTDTGAMYHGKATIYVNGEFVFTGNSASLHAACPDSPAPYHQCAFASTSTEWDPNKDMLLIVTDKANAISVDMSGQSTQYQGGIMCTPTSTANFAGNNVVVEGPIICGKYSWGNNTVLNPLPTIFVQNMPNGAPNWPATISPPVITSSG